MTKTERKASRLLTRRIQELEAIIAGDLDRLSSNDCGLCNVYDKAEWCADCPVFPCNVGSASYRRNSLSYAVFIDQEDIAFMAKQHLKWLLATMESNGWEYDYETN